MNQKAIAAMLLPMLAALPAAFAKDPAPGAGTGASGVELVQTVPKPRTPAKRVGGPDPEADARHCLEFSSNLQVHVCAEKYRWSKRGS